MIIKPAHAHPCTYRESVSEIEFVCSIHRGIICGSATRTGLTVHEEWPVYALHSRWHPEYDDIRVALSPVGFVLLPVYTVVEQERKPNTTPFIAHILEDSKNPYEFDPHPVAWWMYTKSDLVRAVNQQVPGIRYVPLETFQACVALTSLPDEGTGQPDYPEENNVAHHHNLR